MQHHDDIQQLVNRFMMAETTIEEEQSLTEYFRSATDIPTEWRTVAAMLLGAAAKPSLKVQQMPRAHSPFLKRFPWRQMAAALAIVALGMWGWLWHQSGVNQPAVQNLAMQQPKVKMQPPQPARTKQPAESAVKTMPAPTRSCKSELSKPPRLVASVTSPTIPPEAMAQAAPDEPQQTQEVSEEAMQLVKQRLQEELQYKKLVEDILQTMTEQTSQTAYSI